MLFFDLDNTLLDHNGAVKSALNELVKSTSLDVSLAHNKDLFEFWNTLSRQYFQLFLHNQISFDQQRRFRMQDFFKKFGVTLSDDEADFRFDHFLESYEHHWRLFDDVLPNLDQLKKQRALGLITNGQKEQQREKLKKFNLEAYFDIILISDEFGYAKPDRRIFQEAAKRAKKPIESCIYIGDHIQHDVLASQQAGMNSIWMNRFGDEQQADLISISSLDALWKLS